MFKFINKVPMITPEPQLVDDKMPVLFYNALGAQNEKHKTHRSVSAPRLLKQFTGEALCR